MGRVLAIALVAVMMSIGCCIEATQVVVSVDADPISLGRAKELCVEVQGFESQAQPMRCGRLEAGPDGPAETSLPTRLSIEPDGDSRGFEMRLSLLDENGTRFNGTAFRAAYASCKQVHIAQRFDDFCIGVRCPSGETCQRGRCVPISEDGTLPPNEEDSVVGVCIEGELCWEMSRPVPMTPADACLMSKLEGFVVGGSWAVRILEHGTVPELVVPTRDGDVVGVSCWPTGEAMAIDRPGSVYERTIAGTWSEMDPGAGALRSIFGATPSDVWVAGDAVLRRRDGGDFALVDSEGVLSPPIQVVTGEAAGDVYFLDAAGVARFRGERFERCPLPDFGAAVLDIEVGRPGELFLTTGGHQIFWSSPGSDPCADASFSSSSTFYVISRLAASPDGLALGGGTRGELRWFDGTAFPKTEWDHGDLLSALAVRDGGGLVAARAGVNRWDLANPTVFGPRVTSPFARGPLHAAAAHPASDHTVLAVGAQRAVVERVATGEWIVPEPLPEELPNVTLTDVWMSAETAVIVGDGVVMWRNEGEPFAAALVDGVIFRAVGGDADAVVAVGDAGALYVRLGRGSFERVDAGLDASFTAVAVRDGEAIIGDAAGDLYRLDLASGTLSLEHSFDTAINQLLTRGDAIFALSGGIVYRRESAAYNELLQLGSNAISIEIHDGDVVAYATAPRLRIREGDGFREIAYRAHDVVMLRSGVMVAVGQLDSTSYGTAVRILPSQ